MIGVSNSAAAAKHFGHATVNPRFYMNNISKNLKNIVSPTNDSKSSFQGLEKKLSKC